tara:strand:+ start:206 stop:967 length:762 start_codon:yes stop_codon:yes gene_type:complete
MLRLYDIDKIFDNKKNVVIIIQARTSSKRFPKKIFKKFFGKPYILNIFKNFKNKYQLTVVATTVSKNDDKLVNLLEKNRFSYFRGSENNLVQRFIDCCKNLEKKFKIKDFKILRVCADMPFINPCLSKKSLKLLQKGTDYVGYSPDLLDGYNIEAFWYSSLKKLSKKKLTKIEKEHIGPGFMNNDFIIKQLNINTIKVKTKISLSLDYRIDYKNLKKLEKLILRKLGNKIYVNYNQMKKIINDNKLDSYFRKL